MKTIIVRNGSVSDRQVREIVDSINEGDLVIIPTDTLYGITCDALNIKAIERLCALKGINPEKTNLSILCDSISMAADYAKISNKVFQLMKEHTPGPVTFLLKAASSLPRAFKSRKVVGIRIPDNNLCLRIIEQTGHPLLSTSIEYADEDYARSPGLIGEAYRDKIDLMVEEEEGSTIPSAIIDCTGDDPTIIRERDSLEL